MKVKFIKNAHIYLIICDILFTIFIVFLFISNNTKPAIGMIALSLILTIENYITLCKKNIYADENNNCIKLNIFNKCKECIKYDDINFIDININTISFYEKTKLKSKRGKQKYKYNKIFFYMNKKNLKKEYLPFIINIALKSDCDIWLSPKCYTEENIKILKEGLKNKEKINQIKNSFIKENKIL